VSCSVTSGTNSTGHWHEEWTSTDDATAPTGRGGTLPSFSKVENAILTTGIGLCNLSEAGNLTEHLYAQTTDNECAGAKGLVKIFTENDLSSAESDVQSIGGNGDAVWEDDTIVVAFEEPPPGIETALGQLGFDKQSVGP
jgi:hypothetical protein